LRQIIVNLLGNAVKFTAQGSVELTVKPVATTDAGVELEFSVADTGIGIPDEKLAAIFDRFSQVDTSTTRVHGGTGLGLAICRSLVALMGGRIWAERREGARGTVIRFTARFGISPTVVGPSSTNTVASLRTPTEPRKILLVEDNPDNRALVLAYLKSSPHHVLVADNGEAAVEMALAYRFDLVLMDMQMPIMDGYEATRRIRAFEKEHGRAATRIIALTAHAMAEESERTRAAGCDAHLSKPIRKQHLLQAIADFTAPPTEEPPIAPAQRTAEVNAPPIVVHVESDILDLVPGYLDNRRADLVTLRQHLNRRAFDPLRVIAHGIAGSGGAYGFPDLTRIGRVMQAAAQAADIPKIQRLLDELEVYLESVEVARR
jgi:CheY-like chemotaxis protein